MDKFLIMEDAELSIADEPYACVACSWTCRQPMRRRGPTSGRYGSTRQIRRAGHGDHRVTRAHHAQSRRCAHRGAGQRAGHAGRLGDHSHRAPACPRFGVDFEAGCYPQEASLERLAVSFNKGCYIGQEAVFMLEKRGRVSKRLVRLALEGELDLKAGSEVHTVEGESAGTLTSASATEGKTWALALLRHKQTLDGTELVVDGPPSDGQHHGATGGDVARSERIPDPVGAEACRHGGIHGCVEVTSDFAVAPPPLP